MSSYLNKMNRKAVLLVLVLVVLIIGKCVGRVVLNSTNKISDSLLFGNKHKQCIESKSDLELALLSTAQATFVSNHHNLSRALFPPAQRPSLYIKVSIRFANISADGNVTFVGQPSKYTWSKSCLFVATKFMSIYAMNIYSLGAVWPNRRENQLGLTLPLFCTDSERNVQILNSIATVRLFSNCVRDWSQCVAAPRFYFCRKQFFKGLKPFSTILKGPAFDLYFGFVGGGLGRLMLSCGCIQLPGF